MKFAIGAECNSSITINYLECICSRFLFNYIIQIVILYLHFCTFDTQIF